MKLLTTIVLTILSLNILAQDTTVVQTLTFEDITKRRDIYLFPPADQDYRKILMYYTLKCDPQTTQDNFDCGEWDYLTYNFVYDHTGELDSNLITHAEFYVGTESPEEFHYQPNALYHYYQSYSYLTTIDSVVNEVQQNVGLGEVAISGLFDAENASKRSQYLWTADELTAAGLSAGEIHRLALETGAGEMTQMQVKLNMALFSSDVLPGLVDVPMQTVYNHYTELMPDNLHFFNFNTPFEWDGSSNILIEFTTDSFEDVGISVLGDESPADMAWSAEGPDGYAEFTPGNYIKIPVSGEEFGSEITVSLWAYGDPDALPDNTYLFEALDVNGNRALNVHHPWANGRIYWDAGSGDGYDRIDKAASTSEYGGQWNHWAFTKNSNSGVMNIYLNGELWHTGEGLEREVGALHTFHLGKGGSSNNGYPGKIDEFRVWDKELDAATISEWMNKTPDASHPNFNDLRIHYDFNTPNEITDQSTSNLHGIAFGAVAFQSHGAEALVKNAVDLELRPKLTFASGEYEKQTDTVLVEEAVLQQPVSVVSYQTDQDVLLNVVSDYYWPEGCSYWFSPDGTVIDSLCYVAESSLINNEVSYFGPAYEVVERWEIGRFITPYGINLDLGPEGFTWVYDVTDYSHLLRDSVDIQMGNQQELIDVKFMFISGTPPRDVLRINKVWGDMASHSYANLDNDVSLPPVDVPLLPETQGLRLKTRLTGHGHNSNTGNYPHCCEWKDNTHFLHVNGSEFANWKIWQTNECALNPVFPQGGTWPGAREGWCPGDVVKDNEFELTSFLGDESILLDYSITPVPGNNQGMGSGNYMVGMHLFEYSAPHFNVDAEIKEVLNPSKMQYYSRHNPICVEPRVIIRNNGAQTMTSAIITYSVSGGEPEVYEWSGNLPAMESEVVTLPVPNQTFWDGDGQNVFVVHIGQPNGLADEYAANDSYYSPFEMPETYPHDFIIWFKTNNFPHQNSYTVKDLFGNVVFEQNNLDAQTIYRDTMDLAPGCYTFEFMDTGNDGLSYWANSAQGSGYLRFKLNGGPLIKNHKADFGRKVFEAFIVGDVTSVYEQNTMQPALSIFPNPTDGQFQLELMQFDGVCQMEIYDPVGKKVRDKQLSVNSYLLEYIDLSNKQSGVYFIRLFNDDFQLTRKVIVQ